MFEAIDLIVFFRWLVVGWMMIAPRTRTSVVVPVDVKAQPLNWLSVMSHSTEWPVKVRTRYVTHHIPIPPLCFFVFVLVLTAVM